ncbi:hypothetical protein V2I28_08195, partial [Campylobacter sp. CX2-4080-23]|nr:hypothetical protein [Campylobacter sp. CX2-4080-23]
MDKIEKIKKILSQKNINYYYVYLVNSGFGDIITNSSIQSFMCDLFGLNYVSISNKEINLTFSEFYKQFLLDIGYNPLINDKNIHYIELDNILDDLDNIYANLCKLDNSSVNAICIKPKTLFYTCSFDEFAINSNKNIYNNSFISDFKDKYYKSTNIKYTRHNTLNITIHLRLGDCSTILLNNNKDLVTISWFDRGVHSHSWYNLKNKTGFKGVLNKYRYIDDAIKFVQQLHQYKRDILKDIYEDLNITLITDGYSYVEKVVNRKTFINQLKKMNMKADLCIIDDFCKKNIEKINNCNLINNKIIGDSYKDFLNTVEAVLNSDIIISDSRSFIFRVIMGWKIDINFSQILYLGSAEKTAQYYLNKNNCVYKKFINFSNVFEQLQNLEQDLINKKLKDKILQKELGYNDDIIQENKTLKEKIAILQSKNNVLLNNTSTNLTAQSRIKNQLSYKLGQAIIDNSKSLLGYIKMP